MAVSIEAKTERSLVLIKPDAVLRRQIGVNILKALKKVSGVSMLAFKETKVPPELARQHFAEYDGRSYFPALMAMMAVTVGVIVLVVEGNGIVSALRNLIGPTFVEQAKHVKGCIRGKYGIAKGVNAIHTSQTVDAAKREVDLWVRTLPLAIDKAAAPAAMDAYIKKWDGRLSDNTKSIQKEAGDVLVAIEDLMAVLKTETTEDDDTTRELVRAMLHAMMG